METLISKEEVMRKLEIVFLGLDREAYKRAVKIFNSIPTIEVSQHGIWNISLKEEE